MIFFFVELIMTTQYNLLLFIFDELEEKTRKGKVKK